MEYNTLRQETRKYQMQSDERAKQHSSRKGYVCKYQSSMHKLSKSRKSTDQDQEKL